MKKVIITGSSGFIGKNLIPYFNNLDAEFFLIGRKNLNVSELPNVHYIKGDILNHLEISRICKDLCASHLVHIAWTVSPSNTSLPQNFDLVKASINLLEEFQKNGGKRFISIGSCYEYNWDQGICKEDLTPTRSKSSYSACKNSFREYAEAFCGQFNIEIAWARLFFLFGPHENPKRLIPHIILSLLNNEKAIIKNGGIYRDYLYANVAAEFISKLIFNNYTGNLNVCSGNPIQLGEIGKTIASILGKPELLQVCYPEVKENKVLYGDTSKLESIFGTENKQSIHTQLEETIDWWKLKLNLTKKVNI